MSFAGGVLADRILNVIIHFALPDTVLAQPHDVGRLLVTLLFLPIVIVYTTWVFW